MFEARIENKKGDSLTLTQHESEYQIVAITGLNPPNAQINNSNIAGLDGAKFNSSKLETRNIVITLKLNGNVERNRQNLYRYFPTKEFCKFYYSNENRNVYIEAYVETCEVNLFSIAETMQISLICPQPYFKAMDELIDDISKSLAAFEFPFAFGSKGAVESDNTTDDAIEFSTIDISKITNVYNDSESETGLIIQIDVLSAVNNIQIRNTVTGETFTLEYNFLANDQITINTYKGEKSVLLLRDGVVTNIFSSMIKGSVFFKLNVGDNFFGYMVDDSVNDSSVHIVFKHYTIYRGV